MLALPRWKFDDAQAWLRARRTLTEPLAAEVWVAVLDRDRVRAYVRLLAAGNEARAR
jgi:hypothetical protein